MGELLHGRVFFRRRVGAVVVVIVRVGACHGGHELGVDCDVRRDGIYMNNGMVWWYGSQVLARNTNGRRATLCSKNWR